MEVDNDWEAAETLADEDISRYKAEKEKARKELEMAEGRVSRFKADLESAREGLKMAEERKRISAGMRKRKRDVLTDLLTEEREALSKLRRLSGRPSPRADASRPGLIGGVVGGASNGY